MRVYSYSVQGKRDSNEDQHFIYTNLDGKENDKNNICSICIEKIEDKEIICELNCNHQFHESCIKTYLDKYNHKCPICRDSAGKTKNNI